VRVTVNGEYRTLAGPVSVADLVGRLVSGPARGVAVAVNGTVVPRSAWEGTGLADGDAIEVLTAVQGG
jgi:sulfur carrier protein